MYYSISPTIVLKYRYYNHYRTNIKIKYIVVNINGGEATTCMPRKLKLCHIVYLIRETWW